MAHAGFNSGKQPRRPSPGKNGPGDKGKSSGTKHFTPPMPKNGSPRPPGTK